MTLKVEYSKSIPFPFDIVLSQYFDYEHIEHVHADSLGEYKLISVDGNVIEYEQIWPGRIWRKRSIIRHTFYPPDEMTFEFTRGAHKGTVVRTKLEEAGDSTLVHETYEIPGLPNWEWIRKCVRPGVLSYVEKVWKEDLDVGVCYNGWPGIPGRNRQPAIQESSLEANEWIDLGTEVELKLKDAIQFHTVNGLPVVLVYQGENWFALESQCPHTGGPLALGRLYEDEIVCPWHGARFSLHDGTCSHGPSPRNIKRFPVRVSGGIVQIHP